MKSILLVVSVGVVTFYAMLFGQKVAMSSQLEVYEGLRNTSAIIFGVMGAWIAILHPEKIRSILEGKVSISNDEEKLIKRLLNPIIVSTFIISIVLIVDLVVRSVTSIDFFISNKFYFRGISFYFLVILTLIQIWTIFATLIPINIVNGRINLHNKKKDNKKKMLSSAKKRKRGEP